MGPQIELKDIAVSFAGKNILSQVNASIQKGDIVGIVGRSGAGKTTLLRVLTGLIKPSKGMVLYEGKRVNSIRRIVGFASQENSFYPQLSVWENCWYFGRMYGIGARVLKERTKHLLELVGLFDARHQIARKLSGGMKRRLDIALALIHDPPILILDEPTTGLDVFLQETIWTQVLKVQALGKTVLVSSHDLNELEKRCNSLMMVAQGRVLPTAAIQEKMQSLKTRSLERVFREVCGNAAASRVS